MTARLDLLHARVAFRDRGVADVLDLALRFVVVHGRTYAHVALFSIAPALIVALVAGWRLGWTTAWAFALPLALICEVPFTLLASRLVFEDRVRPRDVLVAAMRAAPRIVLARGLALLVVAIALGFFVVPGVWLAASSLFLGEVMLLERAPGATAVGRAARVASNATSDVVIGVLVLALVPVASVLLADVAGRATIAELFQFRPPRPLWTEGGGALATLGLFAQVPYLATSRFFLYLNVRTRVEGWDIQTRFAVLAARAEAEAGLEEA